MFKIDENYSDYVDKSDSANYPFGKAKNSTSSDSIDGTPWTADIFNDLHGARQAVFRKAFGSEKELSGEPDNANKSDFLDAIEQLIKNAFLSRAFVVEATGVETVIAWSELEITYDSGKTYSVIAAVHGNYEEFLPLGVTTDEYGIHIFARRLVDGGIVAGTRAAKWGERKWGVGKWMSYGPVKVDLRVEAV